MQVTNQLIWVQISFLWLNAIFMHFFLFLFTTHLVRALKRISNKLEGIGNQATADIIPQSSGSHRPSGSTHHNSLIYSCYTSHKVAHGHNSARIPEKVNVILKPLQEQDFARVHGQCLQNPHVLIKVGLEKKLKSVIELLQKKWTPPAPVTNASFHSSYNKKQSFSSQVQLAEVPEPTSASEELWILSQPGSKITMPKMRTVEPITSVTLSLSNVQAKLLNRQSQIKKEEDASKEQIQGDSGNSKSSASSAHSDASNGRAGEKIKLEDQSEDGASSSNASKDTSAEEDESEPAWNIIKAKDLTLGQLYVILGDKDKKSVELCYTWRPRKESIAAVSTGSEKVPSLNLADKSFIKSTMSNLSLLASEEVVSKSQSKILNGGSPMPSRKPENGVSKSPFNGLTSASSIGGHTTATSSKSSASTATVATKEPGSPLATPIVEVPTSPKKEGSEFRRPAPPSLGRPLAMSTGSGSGSQGAANQQAEAFRQQLNQFLPKFSNRRGRPLSRNIAKRTIFPNRQIQARQMIQGPDGKMKMKLLPNNRSSPLTVQQGQQLQLQQQQLQQRLQQQQQQQSVHIHQQIPTLAIVVPAAVPEPQHFTVALNAAAASVQTTNSNNSISALQIPQISIPDSTTPPPQSFANNGARAISPTGSFASLLDSVSDLNTPINSTTTSPSKGDHFLNSVLEPSNSSLLQTPSRESTTPPMSPSLNNEDSSSSFNLSFSSFLRFNESSSNGGGGSPVPPKASSKPPVDFLQFGDGDAARNSDQAKNGLNPSSFLSHHLSDASTPVKVITNGAIQGTSNMHSSSSTAILNLNEDSAQSTTSEVDRQLNSMLNENSIDFTNKFAKLASHVLNEGN